MTQNTPKNETRELLNMSIELRDRICELVKNQEIPASMRAYFGGCYRKQQVNTENLLSVLEAL